MTEHPIITLTTDFGLKDPFVGLMKGVIARINPDARIIDITHNISRHNIFEASQVLAISYKYFPSASIHVVIVDPGVGGKRRPIFVVTEDHYFLGPDNGVFTPIYEESHSHFFKVYHITASHYFLPMRGSTFHGRDIFAPVAAWLSKGRKAEKFGDPIDDYVKLSLPKSVINENGSILGEIITFDNFGNAISNITAEDMGGLSSPDDLDKFRIVYNNQQIPFVSHYEQAEAGRLSALINSFGHLELFVYRDSAAGTMGIRIADQVSITRDK